VRQTLILLLVVVIVAFLFVFLVQIFGRLFFVPDDNLQDSAVGAFFGAFLAFVFVRIGDFFKAYSDRVEKGYSALVKIQHAVNGLLPVLDDNIHTVETFEKLFNDHIVDKTPPSPFVWANRIRTYERLKEFQLDLLNLDVVNDLVSFDTSLRKLNDDAETINSGYVEFKDAFISRVIDEENYLENLARHRTSLHLIRAFTVRAIEDAIRLQATTRLLVKKRRTILGYLIQASSSKHYPKSFEAELDLEVERLKTEIESVQKASKAEIDKTMSTLLTGT